MKIVYIVGPLRSDNKKQQQQNIKDAREVALKLWRAGFAVICSHLNSGKFDRIVEDEILLPGSAKIMLRCDFIVVFGKWRESIGSVSEITIAKEAEMSIYENVIEAIQMES